MVLKKKKHIYAALALVLSALLIGGAGYLYLKKSNVSNDVILDTQELDVSNQVVSIKDFEVDSIEDIINNPDYNMEEKYIMLSDAGEKKQAVGKYDESYAYFEAVLNLDLPDEYKINTRQKIYNVALRADDKIRIELYQPKGIDGLSNEALEKANTKISEAE